MYSYIFSNSVEINHSKCFYSLVVRSSSSSFFWFYYFKFTNWTMNRSCRADKLIEYILTHIHIIWPSIYCINFEVSARELWWYAKQFGRNDKKKYVYARVGVAHTIWGRLSTSISTILANKTNNFNNCKMRILGDGFCVCCCCCWCGRMATWCFYAKITYNIVTIDDFRMNIA